MFPPEGRDMEWAPLGWHVVAREAGRAVGHLGFDRFMVLADRREVPLIGVGGVVVRPEFQKQRLPARLFDMLHAEASRAVGPKTFSLFCPERMVPYYRHHGYGRVARPVTLLQRGQPEPTDFNFMTRGSGLDRSGGAIVLTSPPW